MDVDKKVRLTSAAIYGAISITASAVFFVAATIGDYTIVARVSGALWVLLLSFIVTMLPVISAVKRRMKA